MYVLVREEELVSEVGHHAPELAVDEVERTAEVLGAHAHEGLHHISGSPPPRAIIRLLSCATSFL